jgi:hypothetical protein
MPPMILSAPHAAYTVDRGKSVNSYVSVTVVVSYTNDVSVSVIATVSVTSSYGTRVSVVVSKLVAVGNSTALTPWRVAVLVSLVFLTVKGLTLVTTKVVVSSHMTRLTLLKDFSARTCNTLANNRMPGGVVSSVASGSVVSVVTSGSVPLVVSCTSSWMVVDDCTVVVSLAVCILLVVSCPSCWVLVDDCTAAVSLVASELLVVSCPSFWVLVDDCTVVKVFAPALLGLDAIGVKSAGAGTVYGPCVIVVVGAVTVCMTVSDTISKVVELTYAILVLVEAPTEGGTVAVMAT